MKKKLFIALGSAGLLALLAFGLFTFNAEGGLKGLFFGEEPDLPDFAKYKVDKEAFMEERAEAAGLRRGLHKDNMPDPELRIDAIRKMEGQELRRPENGFNDLLAAWTEIGPNPIPNGQTLSVTTPVSGRTIAIAVHPTNPDIVYVGTAQGGLFRSTNGGATWTPLMDNALSLAIGAIAIAPSQPETVYVGTGEPNFSTDSFFGVGVYRIDNASTTATLSGPLNRDAGNADVFTGRSVSEIQVHPSDPATIFVSTTSGLGGIGGAPNSSLPNRGIYRSTNATSASPVFARLTGLNGGINNNVRDIIIDPLNPNLLVASLVFAANPATTTSGIYVSTDALAPSPTFTQRVSFSSTSTSELTAEFAIQHTAGNPNPVIYAATGNLGGRVLQSTDGGITWNQQIDNNFCTPQCFYDIAIDVDPTNPANVYLGGAPALAFGRSTDSGVTFTTNAQTSVGLHVDSHAIAVSKSSPSTMYFGSDGGIYRTNDAGNTWINLNNSTFRATQFMSIAVHPTDPNFSIGGTQDNGTNFYRPDGTWLRIDGGDGGYAVIDQSATDTTTTGMAHTYFNNGSLQGYGFKNTPNSGNFSFRGCQAAGATVNGITCSGAVLFYAPLEQGPGTPNTLYYGTDRLYRSSDNGLNHTVVSQNPVAAGVAIASIGISPQDDNFRIIGLANGELWGTTTGSATLTNLDPTNTVPNGFMARAVFDPTNTNNVYVTLANFGVATTVWKTTNFNSGAPTWSAASGSGGNALPAVPVSAFVIDPANPNRLYAGTDIGVYASQDGGANWAPFGTGLPRVAVFDMALTKVAPFKLRIATHGRGFWEIPALGAATLRVPFDFDGDGKTDVGISRINGAQREWWYQRSTNNATFATAFGLAGDIIAPADFTGDGKTDVAQFRPSSGQWFVLRSEDNNFYGFSFGANGDIPAPADYDGDGKADAAVFRPSTGTWFVFRSSDNQVSFTTFGAAADKPAVADFDGDGKADISIWKPDVGQWWRLNSSNGSLAAYQFGAVGDKPVQGDYTGDGKADVAIFRPSNNTWFVLRSEDLNFFAFPFGAAGDIPAPGDYDGDGRFDSAVFRPTGATWFLNRSTSGVGIVAFGAATDQPIPGAFIP